MTDECGALRNSLTPAASGEVYGSDNDLEEALMLHGQSQSARRTRQGRGRLERSHSVCDATTRPHDDDRPGQKLLGCRPKAFLPRDAKHPR